MYKVYIMSDIHGDWRYIRNFLARLNCEYDNTDTIILLGDTGANFYFNKRDVEMKTKLNNLGINLFLIRGNHEERPSICAEKNPEKWHKESFWNGEVWVENEYPNIKYALDYVSFYYIPYWTDEEDLYCKTLVIPGAYSVDKYRRLEKGWSWFPQEQLTEEEMKAGLEIIGKEGWECDLILSHTCPISCEPTDLFLPVVDQSLVDKSTERYLEEIEHNIYYNVHLFGHYHQYREYPREKSYPSWYNRRRIMLFNDYAVELENVLLDESVNLI